LRRHAKRVRGTRTAAAPLAWLFVLANLHLACLADPPTFAPRGQIPPFIVAGQVEPPLSAIYGGPFPIPINVPFRSEDVNVDLEARLYLDLVPGTGRAFQAVEPQVVPAGIYADTSRSVLMDWSQTLVGCHSLTLILTYEENFDNVSGLPRDDSRAARVVWWLNVGDMNGQVTIASCPGATQG
jgi:hypothetical protein